MTQREADVVASFPPEVLYLFLLGAFSARRLGMLVGILCMLLGLSRVLLALGMIALAVRLGSSPMGLCCRFMMFRRLVVSVFHFDFLILLAEKFRQPARAASIVAE
jgi:hypothetical protein